MDLINWSLNAIDTIFSTRSLGSGEPVCPDGTFAAGYTMDAWERWRIVCLAALSVEDNEDIYLFGTMITGLLLFGLGFALGYRRIQKTVTAVQSLTRLKQWEERSALRLRLLTAIWILSWRSSRLCKRKLMIFEIRMDKESSRGIGMRLLAPSLNNRNLIFFGSPVPALARQGRCWKFIPGKEHCSETLLPLALNRQPDKRVCDQRRISGCGTGWLLAGAGFLTLYSPRSIVWGLFFFSSLSSCYAVFFFNSTCISLLIILV